MRTALIPLTLDATGARAPASVAEVILAGEGYAPPEGFLAVASTSANRGDLYEPESGAFLPPDAPPPAAEQLLAHVEIVMARALATVWTFDVALAGQSAHVVTTRLDPSSESRMHSVDRWSQENATDPAARLPYWGIVEPPTTLNPGEAASLASQALAVGVRAFAIAVELVDGIRASAPAITSFSQIDAAFDALRAPA